MRFVQRRIRFQHGRPNLDDASRRVGFNAPNAQHDLSDFQPRKPQPDPYAIISIFPTNPLFTDSQVASNASVMGTPSTHRMEEEYGELFNSETDSTVKGMLIFICRWLLRG